MKNAASFLVKLYHSESTRKSQEKKYVRFVNPFEHRKTGRARLGRPAAHPREDRLAPGYFLP